MTYRNKLLLQFAALFLAFACVLIAFQYHREHRFRQELLMERLRSYANVVAHVAQAPAGLPAAGTSLPDSLSQDSQAAALKVDELKEVVAILPANLRLTLIDRKGKVLFESGRRTPAEMSNHMSRPEVQASLYSPGNAEGYDIRRSETDGCEYFYFARTFGPYVVRMATPYDAMLRHFMQVDNLFLWFVLLIFIVTLPILLHLSSRFGKAVSSLRLFMQSADRGLVDFDRISLPHTELGDIARRIIDKYRDLWQLQLMLREERERLLSHFLYSGEGIALFNAERQPTYANPHFKQYANLLLERPTANLEEIWQSDAFKPCLDFLNLHQPAARSSSSAPLTPGQAWTDHDACFRYLHQAGATTFAIQVLIYHDSAFELTLSNVTQEEKNRKLKQEMSHNIAHELRTPIASIRGFLETLISCPALSAERKQAFITKAYNQTLRLTDLLRDISLISKTEGAPELMKCEQVDVVKVIDEAVDDLQSSMTEAGLHLTTHLPRPLVIDGNATLLYAIFRNLLENSIRYAGEGATVSIECYDTEEKTLYFSFSDNGRGVEPEHLTRLFERFYRAGEGRTRDTGGTGLGLSIVRNAVRFHGGDISVRARRPHGLQFLFTLGRLRPQPPRQ